MNEKIFVAIASYRDPELKNTIKSLLENAEKPELIDIYVLNQVDLFSDYDCYIGDSKKYPNLNEVIIDFRESKGCSWARTQIWNKYSGKHKFFLQIDSHMRFIKNWDKYLKEMWYSTNDEKAIISHYPKSFNLDDMIFDETYYIKFAPNKFNETYKVQSMESLSFSLNHAPKIPEKSAFMAGGFMFGSGQTFKEVIYDPNIYFNGEEQVLSARLWTYGYNIYTPNKIIIFHLYGKDKKNTKSHWDCDKKWGELQKNSIKRIKHLMKIEETDDENALKDIEKYGFGNVRTFEEYEIFSGISFKNQTIEEHTKKGLVNENYKI